MEVPIIFKWQIEKGGTSKGQKLEKGMGLQQ